MRPVVLVMGTLVLASCTADDTTIAKPHPTVVASTSSVQNNGQESPTLLGRAFIPSDAYQPGPPSGAFITADNGVTVPFPSQPIPGFSAIVDAGQDSFWAMPDNGY